MFLKNLHFVGQIGPSVRTRASLELSRSIDPDDFDQALEESVETPGCDGGRVVFEGFTMFHHRSNNWCFTWSKI